MAQLLRHVLQISALHAHPTCARVTQVMQPEVFYACPANGPPKRYRHGARHYIATEYQIRSLAPGKRAQNHMSQFVQVHGAFFVGLSLGQLYLTLLYVNLPPAQAKHFPARHASSYQSGDNRPGPLGTVFQQVAEFSGIKVTATAGRLLRHAVLLSEAAQRAERNPLLLDSAGENPLEDIDFLDDSI